MTENPSSAETSSAPSRRTVLKAGGAAAALAVSAGTAAPAVAGSSSSLANLITRPLPRSSTGERVPVIGLGSFMTFDKLPSADRRYIPAVIERFWRGGGRVIDTSALYGASETNVGEFAERLGITDKMFVTGKSWNCGDYLNDQTHARRQFAQSQQRLSREQLDVVGIHSLTNVSMMLPILTSLKAAGKIRYVGLTSHENYQYAGMEQPISTGAIDVVQVRYSIFERFAEERILPFAADHGVAVMVNFALEKARLHHVVRGRAVPRFAKEELDCRSWAEFFLKFVAAHPAVTCVIPATTNPAHAAENVRAMRGPLPDRRMRRQMVRHLEEIPGFSRIRTMPWYPGKTFDNGLVKLPTPRPAG